MATPTRCASIELEQAVKSIMATSTSYEQNRKELFASEATEDSATLRKRKTEQQTAENVTESLMALREAMDSQVRRSEETMQALISSSTKIESTKKEMDTIGSNVTIGSRLISKFDRREFTDKILLFLGLVLFFGVVLYILKNRLLGWIW